MRQAMLQLKNKIIIHNYTNIDDIEALTHIEMAILCIKQNKLEQEKDIRIQRNGVMVSREIKGSTQTFKIYRIGEEGQAMLSKKEIHKVEKYQEVRNEIEILKSILFKLEFGNLAIVTDWDKFYLNDYKKYIRRGIKRKIKILEREKKRILEG